MNSTTHPSLLEQNRSSTAMKGPPNAKPNLDDVLARDFAELKVGEKNIVTEPQPATEAPEEETVQRPIAYNQPINAVEDRPSFAVPAPSTENTTDDDEAEDDEPTEQEILATPTSTIGDDFDVAW